MAHPPLSPTRNAKAVRCFLGKAVAGLKDYEKPETINTVKAAVFNMKGEVTGAERRIERAFGIGPSALTETVQILIAVLEPNAD